MNKIEQSRVKNAPLLTADDDDDAFVAWALSFPDGSIGAGRQNALGRSASARDGRAPANPLQTRDEPAAVAADLVKPTP